MASLSKKAKAIQRALTVGAPNTFEQTVRNRQAKGAAGSSNDIAYRGSVVRGFMASNLASKDSTFVVKNGRLVARKK